MKSMPHRAAPLFASLTMATLSLGVGCTAGDPLAALAPGLADDPAWAQALPLASDSDAETPVWAALLPVRAFLLLDLLRGCEPTSCPMVTGTDEGVEVSGDCTDDEGVHWTGTASLIGDAEQVRHDYHGFGWSDHQGQVLLDGWVSLSAPQDGPVRLWTEDLQIDIRGDVGPGWWSGPATTIDVGLLDLEVEAETWTVDAALRLDDHQGSQKLGLTGEGDDRDPERDGISGTLVLRGAEDRWVTLQGADLDQLSLDEETPLP
jgi:hypothetical protein